MTVVYTQQPNSGCGIGVDRMTDCGENESEETTRRIVRTRSAWEKM